MIFQFPLIENDVEFGEMFGQTRDSEILNRMGKLLKSFVRFSLSESRKV